MRRTLRACLLLALATGACGPTPPSDLNLVLITFDTLRADRLGVYGNRDWRVSPSPQVDALAAEGVLFETVYAPRGQTHPSLASILTGKYPITTGLRENGFPLPEEHLTLIQRLDAAGYETGVFVANISVDDAKEGWVSRGADVSEDGFGGRRTAESSDEARSQRAWDDRVERAALSFIDRASDGGPFAMWLHFYDIHKPYTPHARFNELYGISPGLPAALRAPLAQPAADDANLNELLAAITLGQRQTNGAELRRVKGLYDGGVSATDQRLGRIRRKLETMGVADDTVLVFSSDHGEELFDHNRYFFHGASIYDGVVRLPLIVKAPGLEAGLRVKAMAQAIDIAPTVLELLSLPPADDMEGASLVPLLRGETSAPPADVAFIEWQDYIYAATDGRFKFVWNPEHVWPRKSPFAFGPPDAGFAIECLEAYDLRNDPREQHNLLADVDAATVDLRDGSGLPPTLVPLATALREFLRDPAHHGGYDAASLDASDLERLRQLGYVGGSADRGDSLKQAPCVER